MICRQQARYECEHPCFLRPRLTSLLHWFAEAAKDVVLAEKPTISGTQDAVDPTLLKEVG